MNSNDNIPENTESLENIIDELNETIYNGELTEIIEVTYAYKKMPDWKYWNNTLFSEFWWLYKCNELKSWWEIIKEKLKSKIEIIDLYLKQISKLEINNESEQIKTELLIGSLKYVRNTVEMALYWLPFELEKAWLPHNLNEHEIDSRVKIIQSLEKENFGWMIKDNPKEIALCYDYLIEKYEETKEKLTENEREEYEQYLTDIKKLIPEHEYTYENNNFTKNKEKVRINEILNSDIWRKEYIRIFHLVFDILWLNINIKEDERSSIYDWEDTLYIPTSEKYDSMSKKRVIEIIVHEIESHYNNLFTNFDLIWNFRSAWNVEKEEWIAMVFEKLLNWAKVNEIWIPQHFPKVLMTELLKWSELKKFLELNNKIEPDKWNEWRLNRLKRNYPINKEWWQHKDASYWRWVLKVIDYINDDNFDLRKLFLWKVWFDDIPKVERLLELKYWDKENYLDKIYLPLFIWELIMFILEEKSKNTDSDINFKNFMDKIKNKYDFIDFDKLQIPQVEFSTKRKIYYIMELLKEKNN